MDLSGMLNKLREEVREMVRQEIANAIEYTKYSVSSKTGTGDKVSGRKGEGSEYDNEAQRIQHFGFRSRPTKDTPAIRLSVGSVSNSVIIGEDAVDRYGPQELDDGETALYNKIADCLFRMFADGSININAASGKKVYAGTKDGTGTEPAVLGNSLQTRLADLESKFIAHTHVVTYNAGPTPGATATSAATASLLPHSGDNIKAANVEVK